ncbi:hypothetical protein HaLaN_25081, partial [Haematococcus lacustris]
MAHAGNRFPAASGCSRAAPTASRYRHKEGQSTTKKTSHSTADGKQTSCSSHNNKRGSKARQKWQTSGQEQE